VNKKDKYIAFFLLILFCGIVVERIIPHSHIEKNGIVIPNFSQNKEDGHHNEEENSEKIHNSFYQLETFDSNLSCCYFSIQFFLYKNKEIQLELKNQLCKKNYNILPKILNSILFIIHLYSTKAPPFFN
jgi:hypothetical protein